MDGMDSTDYQNITGGTGYDTSTPVDTSNTPASGNPSVPVGGWSAPLSYQAFNNLLGAAVSVDAINHGKNLPMAYGQNSTLAPAAAQRKNNNMFILLMVIGVVFLIKEEK